MFILLPASLLLLFRILWVLCLLFISLWYSVEFVSGCNRSLGPWKSFDILNHLPAVCQTPPRNTRHREQRRFNWLYECQRAAGLSCKWSQTLASTLTCFLQRDNVMACRVKLVRQQKIWQSVFGYASLPQIHPFNDITHHPSHWTKWPSVRGTDQWLPGGASEGGVAGAVL